uniref:cation:proton antiporter domain-containing protein n=1 Tax=Rothia dentocariosa TaxID=2047 RepID=UPI003FA360C9
MKEHSQPLLCEQPEVSKVCFLHYERSGCFSACPALAAAHTHILAAGPHEASGVEGTAQYVSIFWVTLAALLSPIMSRLTGKRIPDVVFLLICGVLIGPNVLGLASGSDGGIPLLKELGLGMLFLIAGFEINVNSLRNRQGKSAIVTWFICFGLGVLGRRSSPVSPRVLTPILRWVLH